MTREEMRELADCDHCWWTSPLWQKKTHAALCQLLAETEWQPIETAPKDGEPLLGYDLYDDGYVMRWRMGIWQTLYGEPVRPTRWMPFPAPPKEDS